MFRSNRDFAPQNQYWIVVVIKKQGKLTKNVIGVLSSWAKTICFYLNAKIDAFHVLISTISNLNICNLIKHMVG